MVKWEYQSLTKIFGAIEVVDLRLAWFNELGDSGWEIVREDKAFNRDYTTCSVFILIKRVKLDA